MRVLLLLLALLLAHPAGAQSFPPLSGRVVDAADLLQPAQEAALDAKLAGLEQATSRQLVVATIPSLEGYDIADYGYRLGRHWQIGQSEANNGAILIVAPNDRRMRIEVGYGLEGVLTDALSSQIIREVITPRFRENDYLGGIDAGVDAIIAQLQAPPEAAEQRAMEAARAEASNGEEGGSAWPLIFWIIVILFIVIPMIRSGFGGRRYRGGSGPVVIWGPGLGGSSWGGSSSGSSWSSGGSSWGGSSGGFSGGGGSFGGGGASGGW